jgi:hypothetical protein
MGLLASALKAQAKVQRQIVVPTRSSRCCSSTEFSWFELLHPETPSFSGQSERDQSSAAQDSLTLEVECSGYSGSVRQYLGLARHKTVEP